MRKHSVFAVSLALLAGVGGCESTTDIEGPPKYIALLNGANERPNAVTTNATGTFTAQINEESGTMSYAVTWSGLSGSITGAHIHGPSDASGTAGVLVNFQALPAGSTNGAITTGAAGSASGNLDLDGAITATVSGAQLREMLDNGQLYVNIHTAANTGGEIRGQITRQQ